MSQDPHPYSYDIRQQNTISLTDPGADSNFSFTNPDNERFEILALDFQFVTSANAGNRNIEVRLTYGAVTMRIALSPVIQIISETIQYQLVPSSANFIDAGGTLAIIAIPHRLTIPIGGTLEIIRVGAQLMDELNMGGLTYLYYKELP